MKTTEVEFTTEYFLRCFEDHLVLVGNTHELGYWLPANAPRTSYDSGNHRVAVMLPSESTVECKWAVLDQGNCKYIIYINT